MQSSAPDEQEGSNLSSTENIHNSDGGFLWNMNQVDCINFDELLMKLGADPHVIEKAKTPLVMVISQDGNTIGVNIKNPHDKHQIFAKLGEEFDEKTPDGRVAKTTVTMEGGKLVHVQKWHGKEIRSEREIKDGKMVVTSTFEGVTSVRTLEKV